MKKHLLDMTLSEIPRWIISSTYIMFLTLLLPFLLPSCEFSHYCMGVFTSISTIYITVLVLFPYQKTRKN